MGYECKILLDSISEAGKRLTTFEVTFPRLVLSEFNTHRMLSRNSASSRAIPFSKQLERVMTDPFIPERFPINGKGMQPQEYYEPNSFFDNKRNQRIGDRWLEGGKYKYEIAQNVWIKARDVAVEQAKKLVGQLPAAYENSGNDFRSDKEVLLNVHKQIANRLLEPFMWHTVICTATEFDNFFKLRCDETAQREIQIISDMMYEAYHFYDKYDEDDISHGVAEENNISLQQKLKVGEWHCPLVSGEDTIPIQDCIMSIRDKLIPSDRKRIVLYEPTLNEQFLTIKKKVSTARCARVSYLTHSNTRDIEKDIELFSKLTGDPKHASPMEHVATPYHREINKMEYDGIKLVLDSPKHYQHLEFKETLQISDANNKYWVLPRIGNFFGFKQYRKEFLDENCAHFRKE